MSTLSEAARFAIDNGYYAEDYSPRKCFKCGSLSVYHVTTGQIEYIVCEFSARCADCGTELGYWVTGYYDPDFCESAGEYLMENNDESK